ncbi:hypothetical protein B0T26DRAFT_647463 [Lasiosphaeria miniovina]|uniref:Uncharacterized protein n=1 Tax=Lasiosphaeria miniovina TaxID=1954250 RepID=A0AA40ALY3_9PEZI|nr:uncharacterized protein B0T26DRAFT_647463 [Lasiosphaeria miniovina]KAK0718286.1 hypothetical protein B0T26DRAFT_647463 [Lasiosphaeria miniovina]
MSVFSLIKRGRQAAKEHSAKQAEKQKQEADKPPYRHVPRHAAIDAMSGGPATWREVDRERIQEQNRRRSIMTANGVGMGGMGGMMTPVHAVGLPRLNSSLSHVSYPSAYASPVVHIPRNYSYSGVPSGWGTQPSELNYHPVDFANMPSKGKEVERLVADSGAPSRSSSRLSNGRSPVEGPAVSTDNTNSPVDSSGNSTSSQDDLEMKTVKHTLSSNPTTRAKTPKRPLSETDSVHRLHPGHSRRLSDTSRQVMSTTSLAAAGIPPVPALPPLQLGSPLPTSGVSSSATSIASSTTVVQIASSASLSAKAAIPVTAAAVREDENTKDLDMPELPRSEADVAVVVAEATAYLSAPKTGWRMSKMTRFTELGTINSTISASIETNPPPQKEAVKIRPISVVTALPTSFDEASLPPPQELVLPPPKSGKLSKVPSPKVPVAKASKKNRWSFRSSKSPAVAV